MNYTIPMDVDKISNSNSANKEESNFTSSSLNTPADQLESEYGNNNNAHIPNSNPQHDLYAQILENNPNVSSIQQNEEYGSNNNISYQNNDQQPDLYANNSNFLSMNQYGGNNNIPYNLLESNSSINQQDEFIKIKTRLQEASELEAENLSLRAKLKEAEENCKSFEEALNARPVDQHLSKSTEQSTDELYKMIDEQELEIKEQKSKIKEQGDKLTTYEGLFDQLRNDNKVLKQNSEYFESQCSKLEQRLNDKKSQNQLLKKRNKELEDEASNYQSALGVAKNFKMSDDDRNHNVQLNGDILLLQDKIDEYVTNLVKNKVDVKIEEITKLLPLYECQIKIDLKKPDKQFLKAILQRHVLEIIFKFAKYYFSRDEKDYYLESDVVKKTGELHELMETFACTRDGSDEITNDTPIRLRQLIYTALGMRGLGNIVVSNKSYLHKSIDNFMAGLNNKMNQFRVVIDPKKKEYVDGLAEIIIREVFRIFYFRLKIQEPIAQRHWFKCGDKVNKTSMKANWDEDEIDDLVVELCTFPLIYQDINSNQRIFTLAKVFTRHVPKSSFTEKLQNVGMSVSRAIKSVTHSSDRKSKSKSSNDNLDQSESPNNNSTEQDEQDEQDSPMSPITNDNSTELQINDTETGQNYNQGGQTPEVAEEKNEESQQTETTNT